MATMARHWSLMAALSVLLAAVGWCVAASWQQNEGHFTYALDDPYIHMAVARNLADHGVFGVTRYEFSASTSSIAWPFLLAGIYEVAGSGAIWALILNLVLAAGAVGLAYVLMSRRGIPPGLRFVYLVILVLCTPLPAVILTGLEHSLHILLAMAFVWLSAELLTEDRGVRKRGNIARRQNRLPAWAYFTLPPLLTMARYEAAFMVAVVCLAWAARGRIRRAFLLGGLGAMPVLLSGLVSLGFGWYFLPNSVLLKRRTLPDASLGEMLDACTSRLAMFLHQPEIMAILAASVLFGVFLVRRGWRPWRTGRSPAPLPAGPTLAWIAAVVVLLGIDVLRLPTLNERLIYLYSVYFIPAGLAVLVMALVFVHRRDRSGWTADKYMLWIVLATTLLHLVFAKVGWFYRYEAYLVACGLLAGLTATHEAWPRSWRPAAVRRHAVVWTVLGVLAVPFAVRAGESLAQTPQAATNIYEQQYQMAAFLGRYYPGRAVAANDIGAINFYADIRNLDLWGLGSLDVAEARLGGRFDRQQLAAFCRRHEIEIAVLYDCWFDWEHLEMPPDWQRVGQWKISDNMVCLGDVVTFYAVTPEAAEALQANLRHFRRQLPERVVQQGS